MHPHMYYPLSPRMYSSPCMSIPQSLHVLWLCACFNVRKLYKQYQLQPANYIASQLYSQLATVLLNLNLTKHACTMYSIRLVFHFTHINACMGVHTRSMTQKLLCRALVYPPDVCTIICTSTRVCQLCTHQTWFACTLMCM